MSLETLANVRVHCVDSLAAAEECLAWVDALREPVSLDTETTGLAYWTPRFVRLVQLGTRDEAWAIPVDSWKALARSALQSIADRGLPVVMHNAAFDVKALISDDLPCPAWHNIHDTMFQHHLLFPHYRHGLKPIAEIKWGPAAVIGDRLLKQQFAENKWNWETVPEDCVEWWSYACLDTILTRRLHDELYPQIEAQYLPQYEREMGCLAIMCRAEMRGLRIDRDYTLRLREEWTVEAAGLKAQLEAAGIKNPNSNRQVEAVLRELEWLPAEFTDTGLAKLDKVVLKQLAQHPEYGEVAVPLVRYKRLVKWMSVYLDHFLEDADADGYVHASINTLQARTGRMSITQPPLQTLPSGEASIRTCVLPYREGERLWSVDYNSQEAVLFVNDAQDWELAQALHAGEDLYTVFARAIYGDPHIDKADDRRSMVKVMVLAMMYGAGVGRLALISGLSEEEAYDLMVRLFDLFPAMPMLTGNSVLTNHEQKTLGYLRRTPGSGLFAEKAAERLLTDGLAYILTTGGRRFSMEPDGLYKAVNGRMQGSGADVLKEALVRLDAAGLADNVVIPVHDECLFSFPDSPEGEEQAREAAALLEDHSFYVPLTTDIKGPLANWGDAYRKETVNA